MAKNKIERIDQEITKVREKIAEYQEKLKALEAQKTEAENLDTLQFPDTAQDQQIVCRHTQAQRCNLHPLKYAPATVFCAAHRAGSFFIQCHRLRIHRVCGRSHTF